MQIVLAVSQHCRQLYSMKLGELPFRQCDSTKIIISDS